MTTTKEEANFMALLGSAYKAGNDATKDHDPDDWFPCGAGRVLIKPRNSKFAKWLIATFPEYQNSSNTYVHNAEYKKAIIIGTYRFNQAMNPQVAWASAVAQVLRDAGINASMWSYID